MAIQQIQADDVTAAFRTLFRKDEPMPSRPQNVLHGVEAGKLFTDDPVKPTWGMVQEFYDGCLYLGGSPDAAIVAEIIAGLRQERIVVVLLWPDDPRQAWLPSPIDEISYSIDFYDRPIGAGLDQYLHAIPAGCTVRRADRDLIMRTQWGPDDVAYHGGFDAWEKKCICYCLLRDGDVLSESSAGGGALGLYEPGVITQEAHRGKGYGTIVAAHVIHELEEMGKHTYWSCDSENYASAAIGHKLGYRVEKKFKVLAWDKLG